MLFCTFVIITQANMEFFAFGHDQDFLIVCLLTRTSGSAMNVTLAAAHCLWLVPVSSIRTTTQ